MKKWSGVIFMLCLFLNAACSADTTPAAAITLNATSTAISPTQTPTAKIESAAPAPSAAFHATRIAAKTSLPAPTRVTAETFTPTSAQPLTNFTATENLTRVPPTPITPTQLHGHTTNGEVLFQKMGCKGCHMPPPGAKRRIAPDLAHIVADAEQFIHSPEYKGTATDVPSYVRESILNPDAFVAPAYRYLSRDGTSIMPKDFVQRLLPSEVDDLIVFVLTLR